MQHRSSYTMNLLAAMLGIACCFSSLAQSISPNYEFRGVWVATVENIDWPKSKQLSPEEQRASFIRLLDMHQKNGMNAIVMQVRPSGDAFYPSTLEPWSEYLTGKQGLAPDPYYDPLEFMIKETHQRGMEFHAWLNPYRAVFNITRSSIAPNHPTLQHPDWFLVYGDKKYFNPGLPEVRKFTVAVVKDLVKRYDIDAVHMDDYFYPYRIPNKEFPDEKTFQLLGKGMNKDDWRRSNCDSIILNLHHAIREVKPAVKFGISPFGVWRNLSQDPMGSNTKAGQTNYDDLYADILLWLQKGWIDYVVPQLYWERGHALADYSVLLKWWNDNSYGRQLYIGQGFYRAGSNAGWKNPNELPAQIKELRSYRSTQGSVYFSSKSFDNNPNGWCDSLRNNYYKYPALVPAMPWIDDSSPDAPRVTKKEGRSYEVVYNGQEVIKGIGLLVVAPGKEARFIDAQLIEVFPQRNRITLQLDQYPETNGNRSFVVSIDKGNNVSPLTELK
ncbi:MAG: glycoside hydrolase family 10 protein [Bacteroidota bacterium]|jgi:uncharacterized lipoprotein YddW (UPF0748 family)